MNKEGILLPESIDSQLVKAKVIFELEKPIWSEVAPNSDHLILHIDTVRANVQLNDPSSAPFIKEIADRFKLQIGEVKQYRDSVLGNNEPSANPIKDIDNNSEAKAKLLQDLGIEVSGGEVEQNQFRLDTNYPFCFVMTYNGPNKGFWEAAGLEGKPIDFLRGMQFPALGNNNLIKNKVIIVFTEMLKNSGFNYSDRLSFIDSVKRHELRHHLDLIYQNYPRPEDPQRVLEHKTMLELSAAIVEGKYSSEYIMSHLRVQNLFSFAPEPNTFEAGWQQQLNYLIDQLRAAKRKGGIYRENNFLSLLVTVSSIPDKLQTFLEALNQET